MRAELASLNPCAVPFLSRAAINLSWYDYIYNFVDTGFISNLQKYYKW